MNSSNVLTLGDALSYSIIGMLVVLATLALLAVCIVIISKVVRTLEGGTKKVEAPKAAPAPAAAPAAKAAAPAVPAGMVKLEENTSVGELKLKDCEDREAAMIMAIIADELKTPLNQLRFKSITRVD